MPEVHLVLGVAVVALNLAAGAWGVVCLLRRRASVAFYLVLRTAQGALIAQVVLGALLLIGGKEAGEGIHYMYGAAPLVVNLFAEGMRVGAAQREIGARDFHSLGPEEQRETAFAIVRREMLIMTIAALLVAALSFRAAQVSGGL